MDQPPIRAGPDEIDPVDLLSCAARSMESALRALGLARALRDQLAHPDRLAPGEAPLLRHRLEVATLEAEAAAAEVDEVKALFESLFESGPPGAHHRCARSGGPLGI